MNFFGEDAALGLELFVYFGQSAVPEGALHGAVGSAVSRVSVESIREGQARQNELGVVVGRRGLHVVAHLLARVDLASASLRVQPEI